MFAWRRRRAATPTEPAASIPAPPDAQNAQLLVPAPRPIPRGVAVLLGLAGAVVTAYGLWTLRGIVAPVVLALVLTICVHPLRHGLERRGVPRGIATGSVIAVVFALLAAFIAALLLSLAQFATILPTFSSQVAQIGNDLEGWLVSLGIGTQQAESLVDGLEPTQAVDFITGLFGGVAAIAGALVVVLTTLILMAADAGYFSTLFAQLRPNRPLMIEQLEVFSHSVRRYMGVTTGLGVAQGVLDAIALVLIGVPGAFLWGLLAFLGSFIPNVGYFIALIPPLVVAFLTGGWAMALPVLIVYAVINGVVQSVIQPRIVGNAVRLTQTITFVSVLVWAVVLGPVGAILAIPLTLLARMILVDMDPSARWWKLLLGDLDETKLIMRTEDARRKADRLARKTRPGGTPAAGIK